MVLSIALGGCSAQTAPGSSLDLGKPAPERPETAQPRPLSAEPVPLVAVRASGAYRCTLDDEGRVDCIHAYAEEWAAPPGIRFSDLAVGNVEPGAFRASGWGCGIRAADAIVECWGPTSLVEIAPPTSPVLDIAMHGTTACALLAHDDTVMCWSPDLAGLSLDGSFVEIAGGAAGICGLRTDDTVSCLDVGLRESGEVPVPVVELHDDSIEGPIGITADGEVWLVRPLLFAEIPLSRAMPGPHRAFAIADGIGCGVRDAGRLTCTDPMPLPVDSARDLARMHDQWCVVDDTGALLCWK